MRNVDAAWAMDRWPQIWVGNLLHVRGEGHDPGSTDSAGRSKRVWGNGILKYELGFSEVQTTCIESWTRLSVGRVKRRCVVVDLMPSVTWMGDGGLGANTRLECNTFFLLK